MRKIPPKLREQMHNHPFYKRCCVTGRGIRTENRFNPERIEWHHNLIFAGKQVNEMWCILPVMKKIHDREKQPHIKEILNWIMLNRATDEELRRYSKVEDLIAKRDKLNEKKGVWQPNIYTPLGQLL